MRTEWPAVSLSSRRTAEIFPALVLPCMLQCCVAFVHRCSRCHPCGANLCRRVVFLNATVPVFLCTDVIDPEDLHIGWGDIGGLEDVIQTLTVEFSLWRCPMFQTASWRRACYLPHPHGVVPLNFVVGRASRAAFLGINRAPFVSARLIPRRQVFAACCPPYLRSTL